MATLSDRLRKHRPGADRQAAVAAERGAALARAATLHGFPALTLAFLVLTAFGGALNIRPFELDNVVSLSWAHRSNPLDFFTTPVEWTYPETGGTVPIYRPLAYLSIWAQEQTGGLQATQYFVANLGLWLAAVLALYALVFWFTRSRLIALLAAGVFAIDGRVLTALVWIGERQSAMACLFGLLALVVVTRYGGTDRRSFLLGGIALLLLFAALSKEYGLAFFLAAPLLAFTTRSRHWKAVAGASAGALGAYLVLRFGVAGGAAGSYCEDMGLFHRDRRVCYDTLGFGARVEQHLYNVGASFLGTFFPQLFSGDGVWLREPLRNFVPPVFVSALAAVGAVRKPRAALPLLSLVAANAILSFMVYRTRNQVVGMAGLYAAAGVGLWSLAPLARERLRDWCVPVAAASLVVALGWMTWHAAHTDFALVGSYRNITDGLDPCESLRRYTRNVDRRVVVQIKTNYGLSNPSCAHVPQG